MKHSADSMHRLMKLVADSGEARSLDEADHVFSQYSIDINVGHDVGGCLMREATLLTILNTGSRALRGQIRITGALDCKLTTRRFAGLTVAQVASQFGIRTDTNAVPGAPLILVGNNVDLPLNQTCIRPVAAGWRAGIIGTGCDAPLEWGKEFALAGVAAGALAVNEAFHVLRGDLPEAGFRVSGLSLWKPDSLDTWYQADPSEPDGAEAPDGLWLIGLGHLGQAYCWVLSLALQKHSSRPVLWLQDVDRISTSTWSTSVLTEAADVGLYKTRVVSRWMEAAGFETRIIEKRFSEQQRLEPDEPRVALFGVDNAAARRAIESAGFALVIEAGLGSQHTDFRAIRQHVFPGLKRAADIWAVEPNAARSPVLAEAYKRLLEIGIDECGVTTLASRAVGAPFVGCFSAALVVSELFRRISDGPKLSVIDLSMRDIGRRSLVA